MSLDDHDRPLNVRGKRDAPIMAQVLVKLGVHLDLCMTSPAKRAKATAKFFRLGLGIPRESMEVKRELYHASANQIRTVIRTRDAQVDTMAVFGHNPGMTDFVNEYTDGQVDNIPTCGIAQIEYDVDHWRDIKEGVLVNFYYPKMYGLF